jgi:intracellular sulfur oxidation DsrE/DsrF family protein
MTAGKFTDSDTELTRRDALLRLGGTMATAAIALQHGQSALAQDATPPATPPIAPDFKVVIHASEVQHWPYAFSNLKNLTQLWPQARLRLVVDGSAVLILQGENSLTDDLAPAVAAGVEVQVCPFALREHQIDPATIPSYAQTNLGGVIALVLAHQEGYTYVKP